MSYLLPTLWDPAMVYFVFLTTLILTLRLTILPFIVGGFGYDFETSDYKIVRITYYPWLLTLPHAEIYTLKSDLWRRLHFPLTRLWYVSYCVTFGLTRL